MLIYAIDDKLSFRELDKYWINEVNKYRDPSCEIMVLANKSDVPQDAVEEE